jgi:hypothetical protein
MMMTTSTRSAPRRCTLLASFGHPNPEELLASEVSFSSPFADYHGRADVIHLFGLIACVMAEPIVAGSASDGTWTYTSVTGSVDGRALEAVVRERHDDDGRLLHATLFLRPYRTLRAAMDAMGQLLAKDPLPSAR